MSRVSREHMDKILIKYRPSIWNDSIKFCQLLNNFGVCIEKKKNPIILDLPVETFS